MARELMVSDDRWLMQVWRVHRMLRDTYWGGDLEMRTLVRQIVESYRVVGIYSGLVQVGYARVDVDGEVAKLRDVVVSTAMRGGGGGTMLVREALDTQLPAGVRAWELHTDDAQEFYGRFGFVPTSGKGMRLKIGVTGDPGSQSEG